MLGFYMVHHGGHIGRVVHAVLAIVYLVLGLPDLAFDNQIQI